MSLNTSLELTTFVAGDLIQISPGHTCEGDQAGSYSKPGCLNLCQVISFWSSCSWYVKDRFKFALLSCLLWILIFKLHFSQISLELLMLLISKYVLCFRYHQPELMILIVSIIYRCISWGCKSHIALCKKCSPWWPQQQLNSFFFI